jgi:hypothetical protein
MKCRLLVGVFKGQSPLGEGVAEKTGESECERGLWSEGQAPLFIVLRQASGPRAYFQSPLFLL